MIRRRRYIRYAEDNEPRQKKSAWHHFFMIVLIVMFTFTALSMQGCATTPEQRAIDNWQQEGRLVYREEDGVQYYVECEYGLKYLSSTNAEVRIGPVDTCKGEEG